MIMKLLISYINDMGFTIISSEFTHVMIKNKHYISIRLKRQSGDRYYFSILNFADSHNPLVTRDHYTVVDVIEYLAYQYRKMQKL